MHVLDNAARFSGGVGCQSCAFVARVMKATPGFLLLYPQAHLRKPRKNTVPNMRRSAYRNCSRLLVADHLHSYLTLDKSSVLTRNSCWCYKTRLIFRCWSGGPRLWDFSGTESPLVIRLIEDFSFPTRRDYSAVVKYPPCCSAYRSWRIVFGGLK